MQHHQLNDRQLFNLLRQSFMHSQGSQELQVDMLFYAAKTWKKQFKVSEEFIRQEYEKRTFQSLRLPFGHSVVDSDEVISQSRLWWNIMGRIIAYEISADLGLPTFEQLHERAFKIAGNSPPNSFASDKLANIADRIGFVSTLNTTVLVVTNALLPKLIGVEKSYQIDQPYHKVRGRQRTDGGDRCESKLLTHITAAISEPRRSVNGEIFIRLYLEIASELERLSSQVNLTSEEQHLYKSYVELVELYNANHPRAQVACLHRAPS
jgi:hypothetical protein